MEIKTHFLNDILSELPILERMILIHSIDLLEVQRFPDSQSNNIVKNGRIKQDCYPVFVLYLDIFLLVSLESLDHKPRCFFRSSWRWFLRLPSLSQFSIPSHTQIHNKQSKSHHSVTTITYTNSPLCNQIIKDTSPIRLCLLRRNHMLTKSLRNLSEKANSSTSNNRLLN